MSINTLAWQGLEYVGVLLTGALATVWGTPIVVVGAAAVIGCVLIGVAVRRRDTLQLT